MFVTIIRTIRPYLVFNVILLYTLGIGIAYYNGNPIYWDVVVLGVFWLISLQIGAVFLKKYFDLNIENRVRESTEEPDNRFTPTSILFIAYSFLAVVASLTILFFKVSEDPAVYLIMAFLAIGAMSYSVPPLMLSNSGYGELVLSLMIANLTPALGYKLVGGDEIPMLAMVTFPLTALHIAMLLVFSLETYASDMKYSRRTMILRMGWQNGILVHNLLILSAYLLLILAVTFDLPWQIGSPALLTLPVGLYQIWSINRIAGGRKPQWKSLTIVSSALFCVTAYLLAFSFWIH